MLHCFGQNIARYLYRNGIISKNEIEIYTYGYETFLSGIIDFVITIILGITFHRLLAALVFFVMFVSVRMYTGGYHADSYIKCKIVFILINAFVLGMSYINVPFYALIIVLLMFLLTVIWLSPIENPNKELTNERKRKYRVISLIYTSIWSVLAIVTYFNIRYISITILSNAFMIALLMVVGVYRKGETTHEKE